MAEAPAPAPAGPKAKVDVEHGALMPADFEGMYRIAQTFARSTIVPSAYRNKPEDILVAWEYGAELGLGKMQALQSITVINGRPTLPGETLLAIAQASGELEDYEEVWDSLKRVATCTAKRKGRKPVTRSFSWADAERIKVYEHGQKVSLASKDTYVNYPDRMCTMRARGFTLRDAFADRIKGLKSSEEMEEVLPDDEQKAFEAAKHVMPDLEHKPASTVQVGDASSVSTQGDSGAESSGQDTGEADQQRGVPQRGPDCTTEGPGASQAEESRQQPEARTAKTIVEEINALTCENFHAKEQVLAGKDVLGSIIDPNEKLTVVMAINRRRRELFPPEKK